MNADTANHWESPLAKSARNPKSLRLAINATCALCLGFPDPGWRQAIRACTSRSCGLWNVRPYQADDHQSP